MEPVSGAIGGTLVAGILGAGIFFRKLSRDKLEISRDRAEGNLIEDLIKQRDDARKERDKLGEEILKIGEEANSCLEKVKELMSKEQQLRIQNAMLTQLLERLATALDVSKLELAEALAIAKKNQSQTG